MATLDTGKARLVQLPAIRAGDEGFSTLVDDTGRRVDQACFDERGRRLEDLVRHLEARLVVTETWPFGRRTFTPEVLALIDAARRHRPDAVVVSSVRDILQRPSRPERHDAMRDLALQHCNHVMVHGARSFVPFGETFRHAGALDHRLHYTGYVADVPQAISDRGPGAGRNRGVCRWRGRWKGALRGSDGGAAPFETGMPETMAPARRRQRHRSAR